MAAVTAGAVTAGAALYSGKKQADAAKSAAKSQAKGVEAAQALQDRFTNQAVSQLGTNFQAARDALTSGQQQAGLLFDEAGNIISSGYDASRNDLSTGFNNADRLLTQGFSSAENVLNPTLQQGQSASRLQAALSGALGADEQRQAYQNFNDSPGQEFLRNRQEQAILRNAAALGGGLGNQSAVMQALQENAAGLASQDFGNSYARLSELSGRGDNAASSIANLRATLGQGRSASAQTLAQLLSSNSSGRAGDLASIKNAQAGLASGTQQGIAQLLANQGITTANTYVGAGSEQSQLAQNLGNAQAGGAVYAAQNTPAWAQALTGGLGAYTAAGGNFSNPFASGGASTGGYTGSAYQDWLRQQRGY